MHHVKFTILPTPAPILAEQDALAERQLELSGWRILDKMEGEFYGSLERKRERLQQALGHAERIKPLPIIKLTHQDVAHRRAA